MRRIVALAVLYPSYAWCGVEMDNPTDIRVHAEFLLSHATAQLHHLHVVRCDALPLDIPLSGLGDVDLSSGLPVTLPTGCYTSATLTFASPLTVTGTADGAPVHLVLAMAPQTFTGAFDVTTGGGTGWFNLALPSEPELEDIFGADPWESAPDAPTHGALLAALDPHLEE